MKSQFSFGLKHPPSNMEMSNLSHEDAIYCVIFGSPRFEEFRSRFGHLVLVFQELEQELKSTVDYMKDAYEKNGIVWEFEEEPKEAPFEMLIRMFSKQLTDCDGSRDLIRLLHEARKYRNRLAHQFTNPESLEYHLSAGGRAKIIHRLDLRIQHVIPLVAMVHRIGRAYASDVGMTDEVLSMGFAHKLEQLGLQPEQLARYVTGQDFKGFSDSDPEEDAEEL